MEPGTQVGIAGYPIPDAFEDEKLGTKISVYAGRVSSQRVDALELDLPVIPGESGGPIFDARTGVVIALAESRFDDEKAIGFGVPIEDAENFLLTNRASCARASGYRGADSAGTSDRRSTARAGCANTRPSR